MNIRSFIRISSAAAVLAATGVLAGPLQRTDLPVEPAWAVHLDIDAFRSSSIGQVVAQELRKPAVENKMEAFKAMFNFDPRTALHGISVYAVENKPDDGVIVVYADFDAQRLEALVKGAKQYQSSAHRSRTLHSWIDEKQSADGVVTRRMYSAVAGQRLLFAQREDRLASALDVLDGFTGNLSTSPLFPQLGAPSQAVFFQAAGRKLDLPTSNPNAALVKLSQEMRLEVAESAGAVNATMNLLAKDEEVAGHLNSIAQGLLALMKMQTDKPERVKLAESMAIKLDGSVVTGTLSLPSADFLRLLKAVAGKAPQIARDMQK
jgi:hypothetical protein